MRSRNTGIPYDGDGGLFVLRINLFHRRDENQGRRTTPHKHTARNPHFEKGELLFPVAPCEPPPPPPPPSVSVVWRGGVNSIGGTKGPNLEHQSANKTPQQTEKCTTERKDDTQKNTSRRRILTTSQQDSYQKRRHPSVQQIILLHCNVISRKKDPLLK